MPSPDLCPECGLSVISGTEQVDSCSHRRFLRCPRCGWERKGAPETGIAIEVEHEFWITVRLQPQMSPSQLRALRSAQPLDDGESALQFMKRVRNASTLRVGPFWPKYKAVEAVRKLVDAGLEASISR